MNTNVDQGEGLAGDFNSSLRPEKPTETPIVRQESDSKAGPVPGNYCKWFPIMTSAKVLIFHYAIFILPTDAKIATSCQKYEIDYPGSDIAHIRNMPHWSDCGKLNNMANGFNKTMELSGKL